MLCNYYTETNGQLLYNVHSYYSTCSAYKGRTLLDSY